MSSDIRRGTGAASVHPMKSVCLIGLGNIGSPLSGMLARLTGLLEKIILVDGDSYDQSNLSSQDIGIRDIGRSKAVVTANRLRQINPGLELVPLPRRVEELPRGLLHADVMLAALDSLRARTFVNEIATRLAVPWVDAGVEADGRLVRVSVYRPSSDGPCMECGLSAEAYQNMEQVLPCTGEVGGPRASEVPSTQSPAYLGALAASLAAAECESILCGRLDESLVSRELVVSARHHTHFVTDLGRNPHCRFDHSSWELEKLDARPHEMTVAQVLDGRLLARKRIGADSKVHLRVEPHHFVTKSRCDNCRKTSDVLSLSGRMVEARCPRCGGSMVPQPLCTLNRVAADALPDHLLRKSLADVGLQQGDFFSLSAGPVERHFELGA